jgi:hypothetical protein
MARCAYRRSIRKTRRRIIHGDGSMAESVEQSLGGRVVSVREYRKQHPNAITVPAMTLCGIELYTSCA